MRALVKTQPGQGATLLDVPEPQITRPDQVLVKPIATAICGTDFHVYSWDPWSAARVKTPRIMGHEIAGEVVEVGADVTTVHVGDYVSGESHWVCGHCFQCRNGQAHVCQQTRIFGVDADGCFADFVVIPEASIWINDRNLPPEIACVQDPLGNAVHATLSGDVVGRTVAVFGCGPVGLFSVAVARAAGASTIYATDTKPYRLHLAETLGADRSIDVTSEDVQAVLMDATHGRGVDVILEMSGAPSSIQTAMACVRHGGRVSLMGIPTRKVELDISAMIFSGIDIHCIVGRRLYQTWNTMKSLLDSGRLHIAPAVTHVIPLEEYDHGMQLMRDGLCGKVVFRM